MKPRVLLRTACAIALVLPLSARAGESADQLLASALEAPFDPVGLKRELLELGDEAVPDLLRVLAAGGVEDGAVRLDVRHDLLLVSTLAGWPGSALPAVLRARVGTGADADWRIAGLRVLGRRSRREELGLLLDVAPGRGGDAVIERPVQVAFEAALERVLSRVPVELAELGGLVQRAHPSLVTYLVAAIASSDSDQRLNELAVLQERLPDAEAYLLFEMLRVARTGTAPLADSHRARLRSMLGSRDHTVVALAAEVLAAVRDDDSARSLIDLLERREPAVRAAAARALEALTGLGYGENSVAWQIWHEAELDWRQNRALDDYRSVLSRDTAEVARAIREISRHRLYVDDSVHALLPALERNDPHIVYLACASIAQMRSTAGQEQLVRCLDHYDASVREMAWTALKRQTGLNLPLDRAVWSQRLAQLSTPNH